MSTGATFDWTFDQPFAANRAPQVDATAVSQRGTLSTTTDSRGTLSTTTDSRGTATVGVVHQ